VVRIYDTRSGGLLAELANDRHDPVQDVAFDASGRFLATATNNAAVQIWDTRAPKAPPRVLAGKTESRADVNELDWRGELIVTGNDGGIVRLWNSTSQALVFEKAATKGVGVTGVTLDPRGGRIIAVTYDGDVQTLDLMGQLITSERDSSQPWRAVFDRTGTHMVRLSSKRAIEIHDLANPAHLIELVGHLGHATDAAWNPHGDIMATAALDGTVRLWDTTTGDTLQIIPHPARQSWVDFAPDGRLLAAQDDGFALIAELPKYTGGPDALQRLLRCRVPFIVRDDRLELRGSTDRRDCEASR
jgi:WD40 repeat protein